MRVPFFLYVVTFKELLHPSAALSPSSRERLTYKYIRINFLLQKEIVKIPKFTACITKYTYDIICLLLIMVE